MKRLILVLCIFSFSQTNLFAYSKADAKKTWNSDRVAARVGEVLVRTMESYIAELPNGESLTSTVEVGDSPNDYVEPHTFRALNKIITDKSLYGDCELVKVAWYLPEGEMSERVHEEILRRGKRLIPLFDIWTEEKMEESICQRIRPNSKRMRRLQRSLKERSK